MKRERKRWQDLTNPELTDVLGVCRDGLDLICREKRVEAPQFFLLVLNDPREGNFITNLDRADLVARLAECLNRLRAGEDFER
jgi:hypothetical protein